MEIYMQIIWLFVLAIPIACISWTVAFEEIFREPREYFIKQSKQGKSLLMRKLNFLMTCEYCFSHYITILFLLLTDYKLLMNDWRGYIISGFAIVWIANMYMALFSLIRFGIKKQKLEADVKEQEVKQGKIKTIQTRQSNS